MSQRILLTIHRSIIRRRHRPTTRRRSPRRIRLLCPRSPLHSRRTSHHHPQVSTFIPIPLPALLTPPSDTSTFLASWPGSQPASTLPRVASPAAPTSSSMAATATGSVAAGPSCRPVLTARHCALPSLRPLSPLPPPLAACTPVRA